MFSDLMTSEGYSYDYQYDWLLKKSERKQLLAAVETEEEEEEVKVTKAEKFRMAEEKLTEEQKEIAGIKTEESKKKTVDKTARATAGKTTNKFKSKMPSSRRKTFNNKKEEETEEEKKPDIYAAMKGSFGVPQPKIVTNNVRAYRF